MGTTNQQAMEMMQKYLQKKPKPMPVRGERTAKNAQKKAKK
jgi:hypothetical protein